MSVYNCCYLCEERHIGCHATCRKYQDAVEEHGAAMAKKRADSDINGYLSDKAYRSKKRTGNSGKDVKW